MRIVVTGALGFVASHLVDKLISLGHEVLGIDDLSNGYVQNRNEEANYIIGDVTLLAQEHIERLLNFKPETVYHLACYPRSISFKNPERDMIVNLGSTISLCNLAIEEKFRFVFSSNSGLIRQPRYLPLDEHHPVHPLTPYDAHKLASEHILRAYSEAYGQTATVLRFASVYGPRQRPNPTLGWNPLIPTWINQIRNPQPRITLEGTGEQTRDFVYVSDVVEALVHCIDFNTGFHGPYLIASGQETSLTNLLQKLGSRLGYPTIDYKPKKVGDIPAMSYNISLAGEELKWQPKVMLDEGLRDTINWWMENEK